jgi:hypothetical protein
VVRGYRATLALIISIAALLVSLYGNVTLWIVVNNNRGSLCALKADIQRRHDAGVMFLEDHPNGIPGIPAAALKQSITNQKASLHALRDLDCSSDLP